MINSRRIGRLCQKELRETLRDRRTIGTLLLMPLILYPILSLVLNRFVLSAGAAPTPRYQIAVDDEESGRKLTGYLAGFKNTGETVTRADDQTAAASAEPELLFGISQIDPFDALRNKEVDLYVTFDTSKKSSDANDKMSDSLLIYRQTGSVIGAEAMRVLLERMAKSRLHRLADQVRELGGIDSDKLPIEEREIGQREEAPFLATVVPLILVLMTITGAVYPAIDLTAGERERGTIEAVMASPVSRTTLLVAKYVAVVTVALLTAITNLGAMLLVLWSGGFMEHLVGPRGLSFVTILQVFGLLVLLACFFAGVLLALTSVARSFKEAQAYLIPIMLLSLAPGILSLTPDMPLEGIISVVPLVNIVLLARDVLTGGAESIPALTVILSTIVYAVAGISVAAQIFGADALTRGSEQSIATLFKRPRIISREANTAQAAVTIALLFPAYFVGSGVLPRMAGESMQQRLLLSILIAALLFGGIPIMSLWARRVSLISGLRLAQFSPWILPAVGLLGISLWAGAHELILFGEWIGIQAIDLEQFSNVQQMLSAWRVQPLWLVLAAFGIAPAVFEELTFRGFLFAALRQRMSPWQTIVITSLTFGMFHVLGNMLTPERFLPSTTLGIVLGWIALRTGSVIPGMFLHATHNSFLLIVAYYADALQAHGIGIAEGTHLPPLWLASATTIAVAGFVWMWLSTPKSNEPVVASVI